MPILDTFVHYLGILVLRKAIPVKCNSCIMIDSEDFHQLPQSGFPGKLTKINPSLICDKMPQREGLVRF